MGKGNRTRTNRVSAIIENAAPTAKNQKSKTNVITWIGVIAVALLLVGSILISAAVNNGWMVRGKTAISSDHYKVSGTMLSYYVYSQYQQYYAPYASAFGIQTGVALDAQYYDQEKDITWFDYFAGTVSEQLKQILSLCEGAKKAGIELDDADKKAIDDSMNQLSQTALQNGYSANAYCSAAFGTGVNTSDVRKSMELSTLASKYYSTLSEEKAAEVEDTEIIDYAKANPSLFETADVLSYAFKATLTAADTEATEAEKSQFAADKQTMTEQADALKAVKTEEEFKNWFIDYKLGEGFSAVFEADYEAASKSLAEEDKPTDEVLKDAETKIADYLRAYMKGEDTTAPDWGDAKYAAALKTVCNDLYTSIVVNDFDKIESAVSYADPAAEDATDLTKWLFNADRKVNDTEVIADEGESSATYTVYFVKTLAHKDEAITRSAAHILVSANTCGFDEGDTANLASAAAKTKADEILAEYKAGAQTLDAFKEIGKKYTEDSGVVYENIAKGDMVAEFENWVYDDTRAAGDTAVISTEYGYHVMYFIGEGLEAWKAQAKNAVVSDRIQNWYNDAYTTFNVKVNAKLIKEVV